MTTLSRAETAERQPRWRRRKDDRPAEIVQAALAVFVERGFAATRLDDIAARAGVAKGTLYLYFRSKDVLLKAVVESTLLHFLSEAEAEAERYDGPTAELVRLLVRRWWQSIGQSGASGISKLMIAEAANFPELARFYLSAVVDRGRSLVTRVLERGAARGEFVLGDLGATAETIMAAILHAALWQHSYLKYDERAVDAERYLETHVAILLRGIAAHPEASLGGASLHSG